QVLACNKRSDTGDKSSRLQTGSAYDGNRKIFGHPILQIKFWLDVLQHVTRNVVCHREGKNGADGKCIMRCIVKILFRQLRVQIICNQTERKQRESLKAIYHVHQLKKLG